MQQDIAKITSTYPKDLAKVRSDSDRQAFQAKYNSLTRDLMRKLTQLPLSQKKKYGPLLNQLKSDIRQALSAHLNPPEPNRHLDLTIPARPAPMGHLHPTSVVIQELNQFFNYHGFSIGEGPEAETAEYNFRKLNLPEGHPATDLQDSLFIKEPTYVMRTHTSSVETRYLTDHKPPMRIAVPGTVYRNETKNSTNSSFFYQYQGFVIDKGITIQHLKSMLTEVHQFLFGADVILRYRYKYYPEVSPGMGVDMQCQFCHGKGCQVCKHRGWIETLGSGMIHFNTLKLCGINPHEYTGYAFGMGLDRLVMNKYGINDIRKLYGGDLVYT